MKPFFKKPLTKKVIKNRIMSNDTKILYWKVYLDKENTDAFFVDTIDNITENAAQWLEDAYDNDSYPPVIEPILMTETEFKNQPEFEGF